jgi:hypothetical protein
MTSYIDSPDVATTARPAINPLLQALPFSGLMPGLFALWTLPFSAAQMWTQGLCSLATRREPEEDRGHAESSQLPVPNPLQKAKDSELFA